MKISFFEDFPTKENLSKLRLINFPTKLYLAAPSLKEFNEIKKSIKNRHIKEFIYWPILKRSEGYWISPFSKRSALKRIFKETKKTAIMLDLELPTRQNPFLYVTQFLNFFRNKSLIKEFIHNYNKPVYLAEYYPESKLSQLLLRFWGLHYKSKKVKVIKMIYHSLHNFKEEYVRKELETGVRELGKNYLVALGTISVGIHGNEPNIKLEQLEMDLKLAREANVNEIIIFRLGGLNKKYLRVLKKFA